MAVTDEALREPQVRFIDAAHCYSMVHRDCASRMDAIASNAESHGTLVHAIHAACSCGTDRTRCRSCVSAIATTARDRNHVGIANAIAATITSAIAAAPHLA